MTEVDQAQLLGHLPPHVRDELLRRVAVIKRYVADKSRINAEAGAAELGLGIVHFKKLAHVWEMHGRADRLPGAEWPKTKSVATTAEQIAILKEAADATPGATVEALAREAARLGSVRGIRMPSRGTMRDRLIELRQQQIPEGTFGNDCHLVVVHAALDIPVEMPGGSATMPVAALIVHPRTRQVLGIALALEGPDPRITAMAIMRAVERIPISSLAVARDGPIHVAMDTLPAAGWAGLRDALAQAGAEMTGEERRLPRRDLATAYLGRKVGGVEVRPRFATRKPAERTPYFESGQVALTMEQANDFATSRMVVTVRPAATGQAVDRLREGIADWLRSGI